MQGTIKQIRTAADTSVLDPHPSDLRAWLEEQAAQHKQLGLRWLLAHCHDGVIWGELREGALALSCDLFTERGLTLRLSTLQQARLFGADGELLLWPGPRGTWQITLRRDEPGDEAHYFDEQHLLWGTRVLDEKKGFLQLAEGVQGIVHTPPITSPPSSAKQNEARARLKVRHYLGEDPTTGMLRVVGGRLVELLAPQTA